MALPCSRWIRTYNVRECLQVDLMAGITVGIMLVPQVVVLLFYFLRFSFFSHDFDFLGYRLRFSLA